MRYCSGSVWIVTLATAVFLALPAAPAGCLLRLAPTVGPWALASGLPVVGKYNLGKLFLEVNTFLGIIFLDAGRDFLEEFQEKKSPLDGGHEKAPLGERGAFLFGARFLPLAAAYWRHGNNYMLDDWC